MATKHKAAVNFIFFTILLDVIGFGIIIPVMPKLLVELLNIDVNEAALYGGDLLMAFAIAQFICAPIVGSLSDQFGRRAVLLVSLFGFSLDYLILALAPTYSWLVIGRIIAGITGSSFSTASAYIADISTEENRTKNFGMIGAAFGLGFVLGPLIGGLLGELGSRVPFYAAAGLTMLNFLYGYFVLPESLTLENRRKFDWKRANPIGTLRQLINYKAIRWLLLAFTILHFGIHAINTNWAYFTKYRFGWTEAMIGISLGVVGVVVGFVQASLAQKAAKTFGIKRSIYFGFALYTLGMFLFAFASTSWMMYLFIIPYCLGGIAMPNFQSYLVGNVPENEQGELQGGLTSLISLTTIAGPPAMTGIFYYFTSDIAPIYFPGSAFILGGICMLISFLISFYVLRSKGAKVVED